MIVSQDLEKLKILPKKRLGSWPSPVHMDFGNRYIWIKRDDCSGYGRGGIKTRKLEAMLGHWEAKGIKTVVGIVANISNLRKDLELYAQTHPLQLRLLVTNEPILTQEKRASLQFEQQTSYKLIGASYLGGVAHMVCTYVSARIRQPKTAWFLPSLAHPASVMGAAGGLLEMYEQFQAMKVNPPKHIFVSACTGSSAAGLILAAALLKSACLSSIKIHVTQVFPGNLRRWISYLIRWTKLWYRLDVPIKSLEFEVHHSHPDVPYGKHSSALISICDEVREAHQLHIDPIYGARAWATMADMSPRLDRVLFWHCGYTPDWSLLA